MVTAVILLKKLDEVDEDFDYNYNESHYGDQLGNHSVYYRNKWGGKPPKIDLKHLHNPVDLVIISHTSTYPCNSFENCSKIVQNIQENHFSKPSRSRDIGYNFLIGGDGGIYVGRGWEVENFHRKPQSIGISFIGDFNYDVLTDDMEEAASVLLQQGVDLGKVAENYLLVGENQTNPICFLSPGANVYRIIKKWPQFCNKIMI